VVELHEVAEEYRSSFPGFIARLSPTVERHLCSSGVANRDLAVSISGTLEHLLREYVAAVFEASQTRVSNDPCAIPRRPLQRPTEDPSPPPVSRTRTPSFVSSVVSPVPRLLAPNPMQRRNGHVLSRAMNDVVSLDLSAHTSSASLEPSHRSSFVGSTSSRSSIRASLPSHPTTSPVSAPSPDGPSHLVPEPANQTKLGLRNEYVQGVQQAAHSFDIDASVVDVGCVGGGSFGDPLSPWKSTSVYSNTIDCLQDALSGEDGAAEEGDSYFVDAVAHNISRQGWVPDAEQSLNTMLSITAAMDPELELMGSGEASEVV
jgi:hypothetical protein